MLQNFGASFVIFIENCYEVLRQLKDNQIPSQILITPTTGLVVMPTLQPANGGGDLEFQLGKDLAFSWFCCH